MLSNDLSAYFITNCGVLLKNEKHSILIDALYKRPEFLPPGDYGFSLNEPNPEVLKDILQRKDIFSDVDIILFTHTHWDHADMVLATEYRNTCQVPVFYPSEEDGSNGVIFEDESLTIERFASFHDIPSNPDNKIHCCYRITMSGKVYLFTGDLDVFRPVPEVLAQKPISGLFFNLHHLLVPEGRHLVTEFFKPEELYIQHLPNPDFDVYGLTKRLQNKLKVYGSGLPPFKVLSENNTRIF